MWRQGFVGGNCWAFIAKKNSAILFHFHFYNKKKHISNIKRQIVLGWTLHQLKDFSWICVYGLPHTQLMLFMSQVFFLQEILLIAEIIIIATRCLIRWEWQNFHRPYSRKNFRRLSSHKKRHKLTPHVLLKTKIYEYSRIDTEAHTIFIQKIPNWFLIIS